MLILSRSVGDAICIGDNIVVTVTKIIGDAVKLGVDAPPEVPVFRRELHEQIQSEREAGE